MKRLLMAFATTALSTAAQAGSLSLDSRADFESNQYNDAAESSGLLGIPTNARDNHRFALQTLRLDFKGNFTEDTAFRLRYRLNSGTNAATTNSRDNLNSSVDFAYVQHRFFENFHLQAGKFGTDIGGVEGMTSGPDLYFTSLSYSEENPIRYATGLKAMYTIADQEVSLMTVNQQTDADINGTGTATANSGGFDQNREAYGIVYKGSFLDKTLQPVLSMHEDNLQPTNGTASSSNPNPTEAKKYSYYAAGLKYDMNPIFLELDYLYNTYKSRNVLDETDKTTSIVATLGYRMDNWVFKVKGEGSETEIFATSAGVTSSTKPKQNTYAGIVEYLPTNDKHFRYHLAYVTRDVKPDTGDSKNHQQLIAGVRLFADFLK